MCYICTFKYYSFIKKNECLPFGTIWTDLEGIMLSGTVRQRKTNTLYYHLYVEPKIRNNQMNLIEQTHRHREQTVVTYGERKGERMK